MAIFRCKMCGGDLEIQDGATSCVCEFCGTRQTLPSNQDENLQGLFNRANVLRIKSEFDKAADIYEKILQADQTEAEAYWGLILCKYGIEYVEDPATYKRIPTCHRASYDAVTTDEDYKNALKYADAVQREIYETEAAKIEEIQKGILAIAQKESPYDVFICYKETDDSGNRTQDSVIANDIYYQLKNEGFKVFYAAISLEDKLGSEYEPVIFSALNTAKVMLVLGTKPEYFNAVWVKNEWSRFLKIMKKDRTRLMIPCYKDMDPYELPEEFAHLQAQNMGKIGFINDLVRGIQKVIGKDQSQPAAAPIPVAAAAPVYTGNVNALLKRGNMALEDGEWEKADDFFEQVLNQDAECAEAYWGKYLASNHQHNAEALCSSLTDQYKEAAFVKKEAFPPNTAYIENAVNHFGKIGIYSEEKIRRYYQNFDRYFDSKTETREKQSAELIQAIEMDKLFVRAQQYAKGDTKIIIAQFLASINQIMDSRIRVAADCDAKKVNEMLSAYQKFMAETDSILYNELNQIWKEKEPEYQKCLQEFNNANTEIEFITLHTRFQSLERYKDSRILAERCWKEYSKLHEQYTLEQERQMKIRNQEKAQKKEKSFRTSIILIVVVLLGIIILKTVILPQKQYNEALRLMNEGRYSEAISIFEQQQGYKDSSEKINQCETAIMDLDYVAADKLMENGKYDQAIKAFSKLGSYKDSLDKIIECQQAINDQIYNSAEAMLNNGNYIESIRLFASLDGYKDSEKHYLQAVKAQASVLSRLSTQEISDFLSGINNKISSDIIAEMDVLPVFLLNAPKVRVGDRIKFGHYEQDNDFSNGKEAIEWIVLEKKKDSLFLMSLYGLDTKQFNNKEAIVTWETCSLRQWLNNDFFQSAFTNEEQQYIQLSKVSPEVTQKQYSGSQGNEVRDRVFILSSKEVNEYLTWYLGNDIKILTATEYAESQSASPHFSEKASWWLRTITDYTSNGKSSFAADVYIDGSFAKESGVGSIVTHKDIKVRPVMWVTFLDNK